MMNQRAVLITGASGLLGANCLYQTLGEQARRGQTQSTFAAHGAYRQNPIQFDTLPCSRLDLTDEAETLRFLNHLQPRAVIHTAANTSIDACEQDRASARRDNVDIPVRLARWCSDHGARLIHFSTDAFFEREGYLFTESDPPQPINFYGETKAESERLVLEHCAYALVIRTNFFGWNARAGKLGFAEWILSHLERKAPLPLFTDVTFTPLYAGVLADLVLELIDHPVRGILHVAGSDAITKLEFGLRLAEVFALSTDSIIPTPVVERGLVARRSHAMALSTQKLSQLFPEWDRSVSSGLRDFRTFRDAGHLDRLRSLTSRAVQLDSRQGAPSARKERQ